MNGDTRVLFRKKNGKPPTVWKATAQAWPYSQALTVARQMRKHGYVAGTILATNAYDCYELCDVLFLDQTLSILEPTIEPSAVYPIHKPGLQSVRGRSR